MNPLVFAGILALTAGQAPKGTPSALANLTYDFGPDDDRKVTLKDGNFKQPEEGGSVFALMKQYAFGDLDGDKAPDAAAMLVENTSGSGRFYYLFIFINRGGTLVQLEHPEWLGDRSVIERVSIDRKGIVSVRFMTHKETDPACCPTMKVENRYRVVRGKLVGLAGRDRAAHGLREHGELASRAGDTEKTRESDLQ